MAVRAPLAAELSVPWLCRPVALRIPKAHNNTTGFHKAGATADDMNPSVSSGTPEPTLKFPVLGTGAPSLCFGCFQLHG